MRHERIAVALSEEGIGVTIARRRPNSESVLARSPSEKLNSNDFNVILNVIDDGEIGEPDATESMLKERLGCLATAVEKALEKDREGSGASSKCDVDTQSQKLEILGRLVGGVTHDFNNMLSIIIGYSDVLLQRHRGDQAVYAQAKEIRNAAEQAAALTRQLLTFCSKQEQQMTVLNLNEVIESMNRMMCQAINENVDLSLELAGDLGRVKADSGYVGQVLMNLVINARDAMADGGRIIIETRNVLLKSGSMGNGLPKESGHYVVLAVTDTGTGMTDEVKTHLFDTFFTTKPVGKGTGLGLMTCQTLVERCGGFIDVSSVQGRGSTFDVYFPRVDQPVQKDPGPAQFELPDLPRDMETILLVEDEQMIRNLARDALESQGYKVLTACDGHDGLRVAREYNGTDIPLVVTDVIMPMMGGKVMAEWLKLQFPKIKILFTSGYTDSTSLLQDNHGSVVALLPKPYTLFTLLQKVREMLDAPCDATLPS